MHRVLGKRLATLLALVSITAIMSIFVPIEATGATIWPDTARPIVAADPDTAAIEVGLKFRSDVSGYITGIRFYKAGTNTGIHLANLWTNTGRRLAKATFTNETDSGWQQVNFSAPVAIAANTVYVASYHTKSGHYSCDQSYFAGKGVDSPPLHALADGISGVNGIYAYGSSSKFPKLGRNSSNYWVDVVFSAASPSDITPPVVSGISAGSVTTDSATIRWTTDEQADSQVEYGTTTAYGASTSLNGSLVTEHSQMISGLTNNTLYHYRVKSRDAAGNQATSDDNTFATPIPPPTLSSITVTPVNPTITAGTALQFIATGTYSDSTTQNVTSQTAWTSSNSSVATINSSGLAMTINPGITTILATLGSVSGSMNLTVIIDPMSPPAPALDVTVTTRQSSGSMTISSPSFSTAKPNELLLAFIASDGPDSSGAQRITAVTGGGLTWTLRSRANAQAGTAEIWQAIATDIVTNIIVTATRAAGSYQGMITIAAFQGASLITNGAVANASAASGAPAVTLTATQANSVVWGVGDDWDRAVVRTVAANQTKQSEFLAPAGDTFWVQYLTAPVAMAGVPVTVSCTAPTNDRWNLAAIEIVPKTTNLIVVNSLEDIESPPGGVVTLRSAINELSSGGVITFDPALNGKSILLNLVGSDHTLLKGEVYSGMTFLGYADRDYGKSALYARKNLTIDASPLPDGITIAWNGGDTNRARVMAVYGDLSMKNVTITSGYSTAEAIADVTQPFTLARGGGLAVWGTLKLEKCTVSGNRAIGDNNSSRDRGTYGGGIYANGLDLNGCVISGNSAIGYGAAGGGIYSVGGADNSGGIGNDAILTGCTISGNRVTAHHAYGGGIFTLAGGPNNLASLNLSNCTITRNLVEDNTALPAATQFYFRGGGIYMGGGSLSLVSCTVVENDVNGTFALFSGKPNIGGGGIAATIGNAHVVENVHVQHSIIAGNKMNGAAADWYTGSLLNFYSNGYNRIGVIDFSQILVPIPDWMDLSRKHYPKVGDQDMVTVDQVLALSDARFHSSILSVGTDYGQPAVLWYPPAAGAVDRIPATEYPVTSIRAGYQGFGVSADDFLNQVLIKLRTDYAGTLGGDFGMSFGDMTGVTWYGPGLTWPSDPLNKPWIDFWRNLDIAIAGRLGTVILGDDFWGTFHNGSLGNVTMTVSPQSETAVLIGSDQLGSNRPSGLSGDIGAIETVH